MPNILFLCTGNSARSIMAEGYLNHAGAPDWRAWSAGSRPIGAPNPFAIETLACHGIPVGAGETAPRSKSWNEFAGDDAPLMDVIVTVCDNAAGETCPVWPTAEDKTPIKLHWSFPDPAAATGSDNAKRVAFEQVFADIRDAIDAFLRTQR